MSAVSGDEAGGGWTEDELEHLTPLRAHLQTLAELVDGEDGGGFE